MIENETLPPADECRLDLRVVPMVAELDAMADGWLCAGLPDADLPRRAAREIERLHADSALLAWMLTHPETCAEVLEEAAAGEGEPRALVEQRRAALLRHNGALCSARWRTKG